MSEAHYLTVKVIPKSPRTEIVETMEDGTVKIRLKAVPERGAANTELIKFLAKKLDCRKDEIQILSGHTSRTKLIKLPKSW